MDKKRAPKSFKKSMKPTTLRSRTKRNLTLRATESSSVDAVIRKLNRIMKNTSGLMSLAKKYTKYDQENAGKNTFTFGSVVEELEGEIDNLKDAIKTITNADKVYDAFYRELKEYFDGLEDEPDQSNHEMAMRAPAVTFEDELAAIMGGLTL